MKPMLQSNTTEQGGTQVRAPPSGLLIPSTCFQSEAVFWFIALKTTLITVPNDRLKGGPTMNTKRILSFSVIVAGLILSSGISHALDVYNRRTTASVPLSASGGVFTTIIQIAIPAGTWRVLGKASVVNFGAADYARCVTRSGVTQIDASATMIGEAGGMPSVATITNIGVITTTATTVFSLLCIHDSPVAGMYVDPEAKLNVERVSSGTYIIN